jgi:hypothetical protein
MDNIAIQQLRLRLFQNGFKPVPVLTRSKRPSGDAWNTRALAQSAQDAEMWPEAAAVNTGILCAEGVFALDFDVDAPELIERLEELAFRALGFAPKRTRAGTAHTLLLYRHASGASPKSTKMGSNGAVVELRGDMTQIVAFGDFQGNSYAWTADPSQEPVTKLSPVTDEALAAFWSACAELMGCEAPKARKKPTQGIQGMAVRPVATEREQAYARKALAQKSQELAALSDGRNRMLNQFALQMGEMAGAGWVTADEVGRALLQASFDNGEVAAKGQEQTLATLESGFSKGYSQPREPLVELPVLPHMDLILADGLRQLQKQKAERRGEGMLYLPAQTYRSVEEIPDPLSFEQRPVEWLIPGIVAAGALTKISGDAGSGKSSFISAMASHLSNGTPFLGLLNRSPRRCLYLDRENSLSFVQSRLLRLQCRTGDAFKYVGGWLGEQPEVDAEWIRSFVLATDPRPVIFVDSAVRFIDGNENSTEDVARLMAKLRWFANAGAACVFLHHTGKGESTRNGRGAYDFQAAPDFAFELENTGDTRLTELTLRPIKQRECNEFPDRISYKDGLFVSASAPLSGSSSLLELLRQEGRSNQDAFEKLATKRGFGRNAVREFLRSSVDAGHVCVTQGSKNAKLYEVANNGLDMGWVGPSNLDSTTPAEFSSPVATF